MPVKRVRGDRYFRRRERQAADHRRVLVNEVLGRCLSLLRRHLRLRQQELSYRLDWPQSLLSKVENGEIDIKVEHLGLIAEVFADWIEEEDLGEDGWAASDLLALAEAVADELDERGHPVLWGKGASIERPERFVRGEELDRLVRQTRSFREAGG